MGIGMLETEETSSPASALAIISSTDENSNESTLEGQKLRNKALRPGDKMINKSTDNQAGFTDSQDIKQLAEVYESNNNGNNRNGQNKQNATINAQGANTANNSVYSKGNPNCSPGKNMRCPLSTVTCNNFTKSNNNTQQQHQQPINSNSIVLPPDGIVALCPSLPSHLPSTSEQAALMKRQQQLQQDLEEQNTQQPICPYFVPYDTFFLYRDSRSHGAISDGKDNFRKLSDEIILHIFKWLPKKALIRCSSVCRRFYRCARDESLWTRLDLGGHSLRAYALDNILSRGVVILRLAQAELNPPLFEHTNSQTGTNFETKLQYLDLSMASITKPALKMLLSCCRQLKKLSLEHVPLNDEICDEIAMNINLEALNLAMCTGLESWSIRKIIKALVNINSLNVSWTDLSVEAVSSLVTNASSNLLRLNVAGCRNTVFNSHLAILTKRCPNLLELDLSDCTGLTGNAITIICKFKMLGYLSLSRCYLIPATAYMGLKHLPTLTYLDAFGILSTAAMEMMEENFPSLGLNKFIHSSVARPTVGSRRTSIWGLRTRD